MTKALKRFLMTALLLMLTAALALAETGKATIVPYDELPDNLRSRFEAEMISAEANARARAPGATQLFAKIRGERTPYTGAKSDNSLKMDYTVSDCVVKVGETVNFYANLSCDYPQMTYVLGGIVFDENFERLGTLVDSANPDGVLLPEGKTFHQSNQPYTPTAPGYVLFVLVVEDGNGNVVSATTSTVLVYEEKEPLFNNASVDGNMALLMNLDRSSLDVGTVITANVEVTTDTDPVVYRGVWTLMDENGNILDTFADSDEVMASEKTAQLSFSYRPLQAGRLQFTITASDGAQSQIKTNTPILNVEDGFYFTARLNRVSSMQVGGTVSATFQIYGHDCGNVHGYYGWECHDVDGNLLTNEAASFYERSGTSSYTPRVGQEVEFYMGASCEHIANEYPIRLLLALTGAIDGSAVIRGDQVAYGETIGMEYAVSGGLTPYQQVLVTGYSYDKNLKKTYTFLNKTVTEPQGALTGAPKLGDEVWYELKVIESDGYTTVWKTERVPLTGAPSVTIPKVTASLSAAQVTAGEKVTLTYRMSGGSGTLNADGTLSFLTWYSLDGTAVHTEGITAISGTPSFTPTEPGKYYCVLELTDAYHQQLTWRSETFTVVTGLAGDADGNGRVEVRDALLILQKEAGWSVSLVKANADADGNGAVNLNDALLILRYCAGDTDALEQ